MLNTASIDDVKQASKLKVLASQEIIEKHLPEEIRSFVDIFLEFDG